MNEVLISIDILEFMIKWHVKKEKHKNKSISFSFKKILNLRVSLSKNSQIMKIFHIRKKHFKHLTR